MKKIFDQVTLIILVILSFATAITKLIQIPEEMELFQNAGFSVSLIIIFGVFQLLGAFLLIPKKYRHVGALIMSISFVISTGVVFYKGMIGFGFSSLLFIALAGYQWWINKP